MLVVTILRPQKDVDVRTDQRAKVPRTRPGVWWLRLRHRHSIAERHLDALADAVEVRGWTQLKIYVESPPVLWVFAKGDEAAALSVTAKWIDGRWVYEVSRSLLYPCDLADRVASLLNDLLRDRMASRADGRSALRETRVTDEGTVQVRPH